MSVFFSIHHRSTSTKELPQLKEKLLALFAHLRPDALHEDDYYLFQNERTSLLVSSVHEGIKIYEGSLCTGNWTQSEDRWWLSPEIPPSASFLLNSGMDRCRIISNPVASRSVWYYLDGEQFIVSSSQRAIVAWLGTLEFNQQAMSWMLATGNLGPGNSWDHRVLHLEAGQQIDFVYQTGDITIRETNSEFPNVFKEYSEEVLSAKMRETLNEVFRGVQLPPQLSTALSLSGGYDSRAVLLNLLNNGIRVNTISWGLAKALSETETDAAITKQIVENLGIQNTYFETDFTGYSFETLFHRFLSYGEGRLDHVNSFMDGFAMWEKLYQSGVRNIIRADEVFGWLPCRNEQDVRISLDFNFSHDNSNVPPLNWFDLEEQIIPDRFLRLEGEQLEDWRDRLYRSFRVPYVLTALHDLIHPYMEVINPLLHKDIIGYASSLSSDLRTNKLLYSKYVVSLLPDIPVARKPSVPEPAAILKSGVIVDYMREDLNSSGAVNILGRKFVGWSIDNLTTNNSLANITNSNFDLWIKQHTPWQVKKLLRKYFLKYRADHNQIAFRGLIVSRMYQLL